jgi:type IV pilus assembly protein PilQ
MFNGKSSKRTLMIILQVLLITLTTGLVLADAGNNANNQVTEENKTAVTELGKSAIDIAPDGSIRYIGFKKDADIRDVLRSLGAQFNKNIVPSPRVEGTVTVTSLYNVTFAQLMDAVVGDNFEWEQKGNIIEVYAKEDKSRMTFKVFILSHLTADEAKKIITPILSPAGRIGISSAAETGVPTGESISQAEGGDTMAAQDTIVIYDYPERIVQAEQIIKTVDVKPKQVLVEATILSVVLREGMELGVDWNLFNGVNLIGTSSTSDIASGDSISRGSAATSPLKQAINGGAGTPIETSGFAHMLTNGLRVGITSGNVIAFVTALEQVTDTTILANPKVLAVNKQLGQVYIGTKIGYINQTTQTQTSTTQQVEFLETGTKLSFRPYIGDDGYIRMDIHPKDSSGTLKANNIPDETSTELSTNVVVKDGQTIVIGGLFRDVITTTRSQVPMLGDIPLVGGAFRNTNDTVQRQEIIVLLTPHIIEEANDTMANARIKDVRMKRAGSSEELQKIGRSNLAEEHYAQAAKLYLEGDKKQALKEVDQSLALRPAYLEALRLKERIIKETDPKAAASIQSIIKENVEKKDSEKWLRK